MPDPFYPFNPIHAPGRCRWCGRKVRARRDASTYFCCVGCAVQYANMTIEKGVRWVPATTPRPASEPIVTSNGAPHHGEEGQTYA